jgi:hypothetical protein
LLQILLLCCFLVALVVITSLVVIIFWSCSCIWWYSTCHVFLHQKTSCKTNYCVADWKTVVISLIVSSCYIFFAGIVFNQRWRLNHPGDIFKCSIHFLLYIYINFYLLQCIRKHIHQLSSNVWQPSWIYTSVLPGHPDFPEFHLIITSCNRTLWWLWCKKRSISLLCWLWFADIEFLYVQVIL